jgi:hypothetical protein
MAHRVIELSGYAALRINRGAYNQDGLYSIHNHDFMREPRFVEAYNRGVAAAGEDYEWHWRVHVGLWAARTACRLPGDFVECGVNRGFLSSAIMADLDWDTRGRTFYLMDTFSGIEPRFLSDEERRRGASERNKDGFYTHSVESVARNFAQWRNVKIIAGAIPDTLDVVDAGQIAYLHIDMNCAPPEVAALGHFWDRLVPGALVLLDDYAYKNFEPQKQAMDVFAAEKGVHILSLPTGQGLLLKPPG